MKKTISIGILAVMMVALMSVSVTAQSRYDAKIRVLHASPDAPNVDVWVKGNKAISGLAFNELSETTMLSKGVYNIKIVPEGASEPVVIDKKLRFKTKFMYTIAAVDFLGQIKSVVLEDKPIYIPSNTAMVRFAHFSPDAPNVDLVVKDGPMLFRNVGFENVRKYIKVPGGEYTLEVKVAGTDIVALTVPVTLENGVAYTAFATGSLKQGTLGAKLAVDQGSKKY